MTLSVIILNWNSRPLLQKLLPLVAERSNIEGVTLVVADNSSSDDSVKWIKENMPSVKLIELERNYGFAEGYNRALASITSDYSLLLNSDVEPGHNWLPPLLKAMDNNRDAAAVVPKIKSYNNRSYFEHAGAAGGFIDSFGYTFCRGRIFNEVEEDKRQYSNQDSIFWGSGAALMVRTELFRRSGGFDGDFFAHMEEVDWCWRIKNRGYKILFVPSSEVFHIGGGTLDYSSPGKTYLNFRNNLFMILKNYQAKALGLIIALRLLLDLAALINFLLSKEPKNAAAVFKAHRHFIRDYAKFRKKRNLLNPLVTHKKHTEMYKGSLVFDFYLRKRKKFGQLKFKGSSL